MLAYLAVCGCGAADSNRVDTAPVVPAKAGAEKELAQLSYRLVRQSMEPVEGTIAVTVDGSPGEGHHGFPDGGLVHWKVSVVKTDDGYAARAGVQSGEWNEDDLVMLELQPIPPEGLKLEIDESTALELRLEAVRPMT